MTADGITFQGGYTERVNTGDGDFMTADTVWDFKTNKNKPDKDHTLQIVMYWLMGLHSVHAKQYESVTRLGLFNPRRGEVWTIDVADLERDILHQIETQIIRYKESDAIF
ncbi:hypothetical protein [Collinsella vaginalis]|uniref:hypothetical protein n=1 Tax=Collinsella vaginalis TaxID=1870987 RepID=UPI0011801B41|nr:hypothetical protein [Collinsella vaginalis]